MTQSPLTWHSCPEKVWELLYWSMNKKPKRLEQEIGMATPNPSTSPDVACKEGNASFQGMGMISWYISYWPDFQRPNMPAANSWYMYTLGFVHTQVRGASTMLLLHPNVTHTALLCFNLPANAKTLIVSNIRKNTVGNNSVRTFRERTRWHLIP